MVENTHSHYVLQLGYFGPDLLFLAHPLLLAGHYVKVGPVYSFLADCLEENAVCLWFLEVFLLGEEAEGERAAVAE